MSGIVTGSTNNFVDTAAPPWWLWFCVRENLRLSFWCAGDSDLFLLREGILYALNQRQEYKNELLLRTLEGALSVEDAYCDPQAGALSQYIGKEDVVCDYTRTALSSPAGGYSAALL